MTQSGTDNISLFCACIFVIVDNFSNTNPLSDKLHYDDVQPCHSEMLSLWEDLLATNSREQYKMDEAMLHVAVKKGSWREASCTSGCLIVSSSGFFLIFRSAVNVARQSVDSALRTVEVT